MLFDMFITSAERQVRERPWVMVRVKTMVYVAHRSDTGWKHDQLMRCAQERADEFATRVALCADEVAAVTLKKNHTVDAVINRSFLIMFLRRGRAKYMASPSRRSIDACRILLPHVAAAPQPEKPPLCGCMRGFASCSSWKH